MSRLPARTVTSNGSAPGAASACRHCGDACGPGAITNSAGTFCCAGCEAVFDLLASHDLTAFYTCDLRPGRSQRDAAARPADRFAVLDDPNVSRKHAELRRSPNGDWQIVDLGSTNGVKVNGRRVSSARLSPGDEVVLGTKVFRFDIEQ